MSSQKISAYQVDLTQNAIQNIKSILNYYIDSLHSITAATTFQNSIIEKLTLIKQNPYMYGKPYNLSNFEILDYHRKLVDRYHSILYVIDNPNKIVHIMYIFDNRQNMQSIDPLL